MDEKINTEMSFFNGMDGFIYMHFPIRGYAIKTLLENESLVIKLAERMFLSPQEYKHPLISELRDKGLFGTEIKISPVMADLRDFSPIEGTLLLTESCNLACGYCYAKATTNKFVPMSREVAKGAIDLVVENAKKHKYKTAEFRFLGGGSPHLNGI